MQEILCTVFIHLYFTQLTYVYNEEMFLMKSRLKKKHLRSTWMAQLVKYPTSTQVMISQSPGIEPGLEPALDSVSPPLSDPPLLKLSHSLSKINEH